MIPCAVAAQQNLVPNPSFEEFITCPEDREDIENLLGWYSPTWGSPDIHHSCMNATGFEQMPQNDFGWQWARTGNAYVGIHFSAFDSNEAREYIQCELVDPLENGKRYIVEFFVSRTDSSTKANDNLGAFLSLDPISLPDNVSLPYIPQVLSPPGQPITDAINWTSIMDTIMANGGEKYLTIGVFTDNANTNWIPVQGGWDKTGHYYIDDVSVIKLSTSDTVSPESIHVPNVFTPNGDNRNDYFQIANMDSLSGELRVYNRWGRCIHSAVGTELEWDGRIENMDANIGVYYYVFELKDANNKRIVKKGFVQLLR